MVEDIVGQVLYPGCPPLLGELVSLFEKTLHPLLLLVEGRLEFLELAVHFLDLLIQQFHLDVVPPFLPSELG